MTKTPRMLQIEAMLADEPGDEFLRYGLAMEHSSAGDDASAAKVLRDLIARGSAIVKDHPVNEARVASGKRPANAIWPPGVQHKMVKVMY